MMNKNEATDCCVQTVNPNPPGTMYFIVPEEKSGFIKSVHDELHRARAKHWRPFNSAHEGIAIIREEYMEVETEVFHGTDPRMLREELVQLAAMCQRMAEDLGL